ncbi:XdhC family protein [Dongia sp.]|uniref:XdhC family protein n=1 Tax=Dongia sp. TaxID=1977262 RepID=UPI0035B39C2D
MVTSDNILDLVNTMKSGDRPFALATVVRTVAATAAKPGAKAVILADGSIEGGWIGGGCARAAVLKAAQAALADGHPRLVSIQPMDLLKDQGLRPGDERAGIAFAKNMCPSQGTMDVFVEPFLPRPQLIVCGSSPVAIALARQAAGLGFALTICAPAVEHDAFENLDGREIDGYDLSDLPPGERFIVVSTQGKGDGAALKTALGAAASYVAFVGSPKKAAALRAQMAEEGVPADRLETLRAPAGLDLGAISPEEIALSILAEIIQVRRRGQRQRLA